MPIIPWDTEPDTFSANEPGIRIEPVGEKKDVFRPGFGETVAAGFRQSNEVASFLSNRDVDEVDRYRVDEGFDLFKELQGTPYSEHEDRFLDVFNRKAFEARKAQIDMETQDRRTLDAAGTWGFLSSLGAAVASPTIALPGGTLYRGVKAGQAVAKSALSVGAASALAAGVSEAALQQTQQLRTAGETAFALGGSAILGGLLGAGASAFLGRAEARALSKKIDAVAKGTPAPLPQAIVDDVRQKLVATGMDEGQAAAIAVVVAARYAARSERLGGNRTAEELYRGANISVGRGGEAPEGLTLEQDTPAFRQWFGDSKVVDAEGKPLVVYHGTQRDFDAFSGDAERTTGGGLNEEGFFFSEDTRAAGRFTQFRDEGAGANVMPVYLKAERPLVLTAPEFERLQSAQGAYRRGERLGEIKEIFLEDMLKEKGIDFDPSRDPMSQIKAAGYDALRKERGRAGAEPEWMVFEPTQIKSINNRGTFDPNDPRILFQDKAIMVVHRGGWRPLDTDDAAERIDATGMIFAHEDPDIAGRYGSSGAMRINTDGYLDARTPDGLAEWRRLGEDVLAAKKAGYKGAIYPDPHDWSDVADDLDAEPTTTEGYEVAIFDPDSIVFDGDTFFQDKAIAPPFYSALLRAAETSKLGKASPDQWLGTLRNTAGVKQEELEWLGVEEWLKGQKSVTKEALADYLRANQVEIREITKGVGPEHRFGTPEEQAAAEERLQRARDALFAARPGTPGYREAVDEHRAAEAAMRDIVPGWGRAAGSQESPTKFETYQLPGGERYRELLLTLPPAELKVEIGTFEPFGKNSEYNVPEERWGQAMWQGRQPVEGVTEARFKAGDEEGRIIYWPQTFNWKGESAPAKWVVYSKNLQNAHHDSLEAATAAIRESAKSGYIASGRADTFRSSHWNEPNVLMHIRFNERTGADGKRVLFIEEVQSDWHQKGRKGGYNQAAAKAEFDRIQRELEGARQRLAVETKRVLRESVGVNSYADILSDPAAKQRYKDAQAVDERWQAANADVERLDAASRATNPLGAVPDAPFKTTWPELGLKRMIRWAAENGFDRIAWTPGDVQAARYPEQLRKAVHEIKWYRGGDPKRPELKTVATILLKQGGQVNLWLDERGIVAASTHNEYKGKALEEIIGKDMTRRIMEEERGTIANENLVIGGEGMRGFYDKILPAAANKLGKKFGAKVETGEITAGRENRFGVFFGDERALPDDYATAAEARAAGQAAGLTGRATVRATDGKPEAQQVWSLPITDKMRESALAGQPLFQRGATPQGSVTLGKDGSFIRLFETADESTFMHEMGHIWLEELLADAKLADAPGLLKDDRDTVLKWLGVEDETKIGRERHEKFARGFEQYLREGKAPSLALVEAFERFKEWLVRIYRTVTELGSPINDDIRRVMDRMLATESDMQALNERAVNELLLEGAAGAASVGAAAVKAASIEELSIAGRAAGRVAKMSAAAKLNPLVRIAQSPSAVARNVGFGLMENPLYLKQNLEGAASEQAVETLVKESQGAVAEAMTDTAAQFKAYRKSGGALKVDEFRQAVGKAMRRAEGTKLNRGEQAFPPEVMAAAQAWRSKVFDPLKEQAIEVGLLPADVDVKTAASYFSRMWNWRKIEANEPQFKEIVGKWVRATVEAEVERLTKNKEARKAKIEQEIADLELPAEERARLLDSLPAELKQLQADNPQFVVLDRRLGPLREQEFDARRVKKDVTQADALKGQIKSIVDGAGKDYADYVTKRNLLQTRIRRIRGNIVGREDQVEQLRQRIADTEAANVDRLWRMHRSIEILEGRIDRESPEAWAGELSKLRTQFAQVLERSNKAHDRIADAKAKRAEAAQKAAEAGETVKAVDIDEGAERQQAAFDAAEKKRLDEMAKLADEIGRLEDVDPEEAVRDLRMLVERRLSQSAEVVENAGRRLSALAARMKEADPELVRNRIKGLNERMGEIERKFADRVEIGLDAQNNYEAYVDEIVTSIYNQLTGRGDTAAPRDLVPTARGPLKERTFNIPDRLVEDFLEHDVELVGRRYARIMAAEVEMARKYGSPDLKETLKAIERDYAKLRAGAKTEKERQSLNSQEKADKRDIETVRDMLRGTHLARENATFGARALRIANLLNYIRIMGGVTLTSITDVARPMMVHGLSRYMADGIIPLLTNLKAIKLTAKEARSAGIAERILHNRMATMAELADPYSASSPFEKLMDNIGAGFSKLTLMPLWNDFQKLFTSGITQARILDGAVRYGKLSKEERAYLAFLGIDEDMAARIAKQFDEHGETVDGVRVAGTEDWDDLFARRAFRAALNKDVDSTIVTKGMGDVPLWMATPLGRTVLQFKSFAIASHQRAFMRGLQAAELGVDGGKAGQLAGLISATAIGVLIYYLKSIESNRMDDISDNPGRWVAEGLDRSGLFAVAFEANNTMEKYFNLGAYRVLASLFPDKDQSGKASRYASRNLSAAFTGPTGGMAEDLVRVLNGLKRTDPKTGEYKGLSEGDVNAIRRLAPFSTLPGIRSAVEYGIMPGAREAAVRD